MPLQHSTSGTRHLLVLGLQPECSRELVLFSYLEAGGYTCSLGTPSDVASRRPLGVILDISPHSCDGWGILLALKSSPETRDIPVLPVFLSETGKVGGVFPVAGFFTTPVDDDYISHRLSILGLTEDTETWDLQSLVVTRNGDETLCKTLAALGYDPVSAYTGHEALALASIQPKFLAFSSLMLSDMSAFELHMNFRHFPYSSNMPLFILIKEEMKDGEKQALSREVCHLISKKQLSCQEFLSVLRHRQ